MVLAKSEPTADEPFTGPSEPSSARPDYLQSLTEAQYRAATQPANQSVQILAGPGSGKTRVLTSRAAWMVREGYVRPDRLVLVTFTNKAAREMINRLDTLLGKLRTEQLIVGTFHATCVRFLRKHGQRINISNSFTIADIDDTKKLLKKLIVEHSKELELDPGEKPIKPDTALNAISQAKSKNMTAVEYRLSLTPKSTIFAQKIAFLFDKYEEEMKKNNALDFDDLLIYGVRLLASHPNVVADIEHVLVDEFQDTNTTQFELMELLAQHCRAVTTVGDPDQSIYGWRSAEVANLQKMLNRFNDTRQVFLEENFRSTGHIVDAALKVVQQDAARVPKKLYTSRPAGTQIVLKANEAPEFEAAFIVSEIKRLVAHSGDMLNYDDFVILLRYNALSRVLESELQREGVAHRLIGGVKFFDRQEVKDILAYLCLVDNPDYAPAFDRVINVPKRSIGDKGLKDIKAEADAAGLSPMALAIHFHEKGPHATKGKGITPRAKSALAAFAGVVLKLRRLARSGTSVPDLIRILMDEVDYQAHLQKIGEYESRMENVKELINFAAAVEAQSSLMMGSSVSKDDNTVEGNPGSNLVAIVKSEEGEHGDDDVRGNGQDIFLKSESRSPSPVVEEASVFEDKLSSKLIPMDPEEEVHYTKPRKYIPLNSVEMLRRKALEGDLPDDGLVLAHRQSAQAMIEASAGAEFATLPTSVNVSSHKGQKRKVAEISESSSKPSRSDQTIAIQVSRQGRSQRAYKSNDKGKAKEDPIVLDSDTDDEDFQSLPSKRMKPEFGEDDAKDGVDVLEGGEEKSQLRLFLESSIMNTDVEVKDENSSTPRVTLSTCHAAKGLEWPVVFVAGVEDGVLPMYRCTKPEEIAEERRLLYVAITRAETMLYLSWNSERYMFGQGHCRQSLSTFLRPIASQKAGGDADPYAAKAQKASQIEFLLQRPGIGDAERALWANMLNRPLPPADRVKKCITTFAASETGSRLQDIDAVTVTRKQVRSESFGGSSSFNSRYSSGTFTTGKFNSGSYDRYGGGTLGEGRSVSGPSASGLNGKRRFGSFKRFQTRHSSLGSPLEDETVPAENQESAPSIEEAQVGEVGTQLGTRPEQEGVQREGGVKRKTPALPPAGATSGFQTVRSAFGNSAAVTAADAAWQRARSFKKVARSSLTALQKDEGTGGTGTSPVLWTAPSAEATGSGSGSSGRQSSSPSFKAPASRLKPAPRFTDEVRLLGGSQAGGSDIRGFFGTNRPSSSARSGAATLEAFQQNNQNSISALKNLLPDDDEPS